MVQPNWGLAGGNALSMFQLGTQIGGGIRQQRDEKRERNALTAYANDPNEQTLRGVAEYNPEYVIRQRGAQAQAAQEQQAAQRDQLPIIGRILGSITDEASYQRARQVSQRYGIDMSDAPETYDPAWVQETRDFAQAVATPQGQEALSTAGKQATDEGLQPGTPEFAERVREVWRLNNAVPISRADGSAGVWLPGDGGSPTPSGPQPGAVEDGYRFKGGNPLDQANWEPVAQGGGGRNVTSNFLSGV